MMNLDFHLKRCQLQDRFWQASPASSFTEEPVAANSDLPDWLSGVDAADQADLEEDAWKKSVEQESQIPASVPAEEPAPVSLTADLPRVGCKALRGSLRRLKDWKRMMISPHGCIASNGKQMRSRSRSNPPLLLIGTLWKWKRLNLFRCLCRKWLLKRSIRVLRLFLYNLSSLFNLMLNSPSLNCLFQNLPQPKRNLVCLRQIQPEGQNITEVLNQAKDELDRGDIPAALDHYGKLIKKGKNLEEAIRDLSESLYRYPVEVGIWQTLGDAYMRSNRLKEALEAYNKAEELIR
ncbi:tetratricopeptide repeat protein [Candidatus Villigracilis saccharophilus]|uniref:tetratricopeptide repeat protein n=1 Tax=Candidatus Villigracilis saccharophilus TaxID=3140684 RepID=UPI0031363D9A|nr:tetratricopeptide repeat protein [Anaerolineales bacterium]